jgi:hypothetical protein
MKYLHDNLKEYIYIAYLYEMTLLSQPHFEKSVKMTLTLPKWGLGNSLGLSKFQSSIAGVKTPRLEEFFISLQSYQNVDVENGFA